MNIIATFRAVLSCACIAGLILVAAPAEAAKRPQVPREARFVETQAKALWATNPALPDIKVDYVIQDAVAGTRWATDSVRTIDAALRLTTALGYPLTGDQHVILGWDADWAIAQLPDDDRISCLSWIRGAMGGYCGLGYNVAQFEAFAESWGYDDMNVYQTPVQAQTMAANIPHELGHAVQSVVIRANPRPTWQLAPAWLREGGPELFKLTAYAKTSGSTYLAARNTYLAGTGRCARVPLTQLAGTGTTASFCEYDKGMVAVEYLIAKTGRITAPFEFYAASGTTTAEVFRDAYGLGLDAFLVEAERYANRQLRGR